MQHQGGPYPIPDDDRFPPTNSTAVAIDRDKNSQHAVKWAVDHLLLNNPNIILIHVRNRNATQVFTMGDSNPDTNRDQAENDLQQLFLPFRGFCARKGVHMREVVMDDVDVSKALSEYIANNGTSNIVVGASNRNALTKKFRNPDVPSTLMKIAPDFCTVYVISKGKVMTVRSANRPAPAPAPQRSIHPQGLPPHFPPHDHADLDDAVRTPFNRSPWRTPASPGPAYLERRSFERNGDYMKTPSRPLSTAKSIPIDTDLSIRQPRSYNRDSFSEDLDFNGPGLRSSDFGAESLEFSSISNESPRSSLSSQSAGRDVEAEMKRLKLELKQTMDMYSTACKEAITAKQKARELHQWKMEEGRKFEEARMAEEAALAIAEMEKAKCKAAIEAAEASQRIAEMEAQKRRNAEMKAKKESEEKRKALDALANSDVRYRKYTIEEIEVATDFFSETLKIGEGGYGPVYSATLDHTAVAIKVLRPDAAQGRKQFQQEVEVLSCIRHPNMVLLLGACPEYGCLVYEFMENGSLDDRLFRRGNTPPIPWKLRFKIAAEIATGLLFLHQAKPEPLVHRDLKPGNILLDRNYVSKISDVGLARLVPPSVADSVTQYRMTSTAGTFCYIDPEYQQTGMLGIKSDIYSLGIMLLQIITAKPPMGLTHHVERSIEKGTFADMLDPAVPDWPVEEAMGYAKLALQCAELRRKDRPDLGTVVLPELNRLRNLGNNSSSSSMYELGGSYPSSSSSNSSSNINGGPRSNSRFRSSMGQDAMMNSPRIMRGSALSGVPHWNNIEESGMRGAGVAPNGGRLMPRRLLPYDGDE
ncbi:U-box domain-containing protein 52-like isoform X2 [Magnolia sinica]|uniref:U-box domain-containing protein 52-like isoform X2 n=1 Tax=Magnolia sinica TaxID=86752 RepID=UPI00265B57E9|nr:U-box domain-containing protein 52-like isoform X2 [Magnolia sinica]